MKRSSKSEWFMSLRQVQLLIGIGFLYMFFVSLLGPFIFKSISYDNQDYDDDQEVLKSASFDMFPLTSEQELHGPISTNVTKIGFLKKVKKPMFSGLKFDDVNVSKSGFDAIHKSAIEAFLVGRKYWEELESSGFELPNLESFSTSGNFSKETCCDSVTLTGSLFRKRGNVIVLPCG
nr:hydroxyproline O-galactosyltransferase GALT6-like [Tanacetum cinerariifolium]